MASTPVRRPGVVTFISVIVFIQAFMAAVVGIVMIAFKDRVDDALVATENGVFTFSGDSIMWTGIWELVLAVVLFAVAAGLMRGSRGWRAVVGVVEGIRIVSALFFMLWYHDGSAVWSGLIAIAIAVFVLWALYAHPASEDFFEST